MLRTRLLWLSVLLLAFPLAHGEWTVLNHNTDTITEALARCLVAPSTQDNRLMISRIRLTRSGTADVTHRFAFRISEDVQGATATLVGCALPTCRYVLTIEGALRGRVYDMSGLNIVLPPGARLYVSEDSHQAGEHATIEVFYTER